MNWTSLIVAGSFGWIVGYTIPLEYFWLGTIVSFIFGLTISMWWPEDWDIFK